MDINLRKYIVQSIWLNLKLLFWIVIGAACTVGWGLISANALTALVDLNFESFMLWIFAMVLIVIVWCLQIYMESRLHSKAVQTMNIEIRNDISNRVSQLEYEEFHKKSEGTYVSWLTNDITMINQYGFGNLSMIVRQITTILFSIAAIIHFHYSLILTITILVIFMLLAPKMFSERMNKKINEVTQANEKIVTILQDTLNGFNAYYMLNKNDYIINKTDQSSHLLSEKKQNYAKIYGKMSSLTNGVSLASQIIVIAQTGYLYTLNIVAVGAMSATQYFAANIFSSLTGLSANWTEMKTVQPIFDKFYALQVEKSAHLTTITDFNHRITLENVSYSYEKDSPSVIKDVSIEIKRYQKYALIGESGSGKTTLLNIIAGRLTQYTGKCSFDAINYKQIKRKSLREQILYIDQSPHIFNTTIRENITLNQEIDDEILETAIKKSGLKNWLNNLPNGIDTVIDSNAKNLSGGQKQRIALARGYVTNKKIVLLDEVTSSLDKNSADQIEETLLSDPNLTVVLITHHLKSNLINKIDKIYQI